MEVGRHVRAVLDEQRARGVARVPQPVESAWVEGLTSAVHTVLPPGRYPVPDDRQLYEQIGSIYTSMAGGDVPDPTAGVEDLADFLDTVRHALLRPDGPTAAVLLRALTRYEHDRTGA